MAKNIKTIYILIFVLFTLTPVNNVFAQQLIEMPIVESRDKNISDSESEWLGEVDAPPTATETTTPPTTSANNLSQNSNANVTTNNETTQALSEPLAQPVTNVAGVSSAIEQASKNNSSLPLVAFISIVALLSLSIAAISLYIHKKAIIE